MEGSRFNPDGSPRRDPISPADVAWSVAIAVVATLGALAIVFAIALVGMPSRDFRSPEDDAGEMTAPPPPPSRPRLDSPVMRQPGGAIRVTLR